MNLEISSPPPLRQKNGTWAMRNDVEKYFMFHTAWINSSQSKINIESCHILFFYFMFVWKTGREKPGGEEGRLSVFTLSAKNLNIFFFYMNKFNKKKFKQSTKRIGRVQCTYIVQEYIFFISFRYLFFYFKYPGKVINWCEHHMTFLIHQ